MREHLLFSIVLLSLSVQADSMSASIDASGQAYQGNLSVNQAAGLLQQQVNARALAVGGKAAPACGAA
jgi:hypothetical protein